MSWDQIGQATRNVSNILRMNLSKGDKVIVFADTRTDPVIRMAAYTAALEFDSSAVMLIEPPTLDRHIHEVSPIGQAAIEAATVVISVIGGSIGYAKFWQGLMQREPGKRKKINLDQGLSLNVLTGPPCSVDYNVVRARAEFIRPFFNEGKRLEIYTEAGTELTCSIEGRDGKVEAGVAEAWGFLNGVSFPGGETFVNPIETSGEGRLVIDLTLPPPVGAVSEPITVTIKNGRAVDFSGGMDARKLEEYLREKGDENSFYCPVEVGIGVNHGCKPTGSKRTDAKALGTAHVAFGASDFMGGIISSKLHVDAVFNQPTIIVDGKTLMDKGELIGFD